MMTSTLLMPLSRYLKQHRQSKHGYKVWVAPSSETKGIKPEELGEKPLPYEQRQAPMGPADVFGSDSSNDDEEVVSPEIPLKPVWPHITV